MALTRGWRRAIHIVASLALLTAVAATLPVGSLRSALANTSPAVLGLTLATFFACHLVAAFKWRTLMGPQPQLSFTRAVQAHFTGLVGNLTPFGMIGGDVARAGVAMHGAVQPAAILLPSVLDRIVDTAALVVLASAGLFWIRGDSTVSWIVVAGGAVVCGIGVGGLLGGRWLLERTHHPRLAVVREASRAFTTNPGLIGRALVLSVLVQGALASSNAYIGASVGVECAFAAWLVAWPAAKLAAYLPLGVAGIGIREIALVAFLRPFGGTAAPVLAAGLLWDAVIILGAVSGWLLLCVLPSMWPRGSGHVRVS